MKTSLIRILILSLLTIFDGKGNQDINNNFGNNRYDNDVQNLNSRKTLTKVTYKRIWGSCLSSEEYLEVEKIENNNIVEEEVKCNQEFCAPAIYNLTVFAKGEAIVTTINTPFLRNILVNGTFLVNESGFVQSGYWKGANFALMVKSVNDDPEKCFTKEGVTHTRVIFTTVTFQMSLAKRFVCFGRGDTYYSPGLLT